jgi:hypothetical protein
MSRVAKNHDPNKHEGLARTRLHLVGAFPPGRSFLQAREVRHNGGMAFAGQGSAPLGAGMVSSAYP